MFKFLKRTKLKNVSEFKFTPPEELWLPFFSFLKSVTGYTPESPIFIYVVSNEDGKVACITTTSNEVQILPFDDYTTLSTKVLEQWRETSNTVPFIFSNDSELIKEFLSIHKLILGSYIDYTIYSPYKGSQPTPISIKELISIFNISNSTTSIESPLTDSSLISSINQFSLYNVIETSASLRIKFFNQLNQRNHSYSLETLKKISEKTIADFAHYDEKFFKRTPKEHKHHELYKHDIKCFLNFIRLSTISDTSFNKLKNTLIEYCNLTKYSSVDSFLRTSILNLKKSLPITSEGYYEYKTEAFLNSYGVLIKENDSYNFILNPTEYQRTVSTKNIEQEIQYKFISDYIALFKNLLLEGNKLFNILKVNQIPLFTKNHQIKFIDFISDHTFSSISSKVRIVTNDSSLELLSIIEAPQSFKSEFETSIELSTSNDKINQHITSLNNSNINWNAITNDLNTLNLFTSEINAFCSRTYNLNSTSREVFYRIKRIPLKFHDSFLERIISHHTGFKNDWADDLRQLQTFFNVNKNMFKDEHMLSITNMKSELTLYTTS